MKYKEFHLKLIIKNDFDNIVSQLSDKDFLKESKSFLNSISCNIKTKNFNCIYMINQYPNNVLGDIEISENDLIKKKSENICNLITNYLENENISLKNELKKEIIEYDKLFNNWKKKDNELMIKELTQIFWELEYDLKEFNRINNNLDEKDQEFYKKKIRDEQENILNNIKNFGGEDGIKYLESSKPMIVGEQVYNQIEENFKKAYWNKLKDDIKDTGFINIIPVLGEIKEYLLNLTRSDKEKSIIEEKIDLDLIKQMIVNNAFTEKSIKELCIYIILKLKNLGSPSNDKKMEEWIINIEKIDFTLDELPEILSDFFQKVFNQIFKIMDDIKKIYKSN